MKNLKVLGLILAFLIITLQYQIWFGERGTPKIEQLEAQIAQQQEQNLLLLQQNNLLREEIQALRQNPELLEEIARERLGLIKPNETFYRIIPKETNEN